MMADMGSRRLVANAANRAWPKSSDRSRHECKDQRSFELFQFKSIVFYHRETCPRLKMSFKLVEERCVNLASMLG